MNGADGGDVAIELIELSQHQATDFFGTKPAMERFANGRTESIFEQGSASLLANADGIRADRQAPPPQRFSNSISLQQLKSFCDRVGVDRQLNAKRSYAG